MQEIQKLSDVEFHFLWDDGRDSNIESVNYTRM